MHVYIYETNFLEDFVLNKNDRGREKINNTSHCGLLIFCI